MEIFHKFQSVELKYSMSMDKSSLCFGRVAALHLTKLQPTYARYSFFVALDSMLLKKCTETKTEQNKDAWMVALNIILKLFY